MTESKVKSIDEMREWVKSLQDYDHTLHRNAKLHED
jgi:hypothetical protein